MNKDIKQHLSKYFSLDSVNELSCYLRDSKFRFHLINHNLIDGDKDSITPILCERSFKELDGHNKELVSIQDLDIEVFSGSLIPGVMVKHLKKDGEEEKVLQKEYFPPCVGNSNLLLVKKSVRDDLKRGYFNYEFVNVYAIVTEDGGLK